MALLSLIHTKDYYSDLDGLEALRERGRALTRAELDADTGVTIASHMAILLCDEVCDWFCFCFLGGGGKGKWEGWEHTALAGRFH